MNETIETGRLLIRRFTADDWQALYGYLSDEEVVRYEPYGVLTEEQCRQEAVSRAGNEAFWAVCLKESGQLIGNVYFMRSQPPEFAAWELGYVFNRSYQGRGYATESCAAVIDRAFNSLGARRVVAMCNPLNVGSWRLLERLGMRREGHFIRNIYFKLDAQGNPVWSDTYAYALLAQEWRKNQSEKDL